MQPEDAEISTARKELRGHPGVSGAPLGSGGAILMGLPFLAAAVWMSLGAAGHIEGFTISRGVPPLIVQVAAWIFGLAGLWLTAGGMRGALRAARTKRLAARHPGEPWHADWQADQGFARDETWPRIWASCFGMLVLLLMTSVLNWLGFVSEHRGLPLQVLAGLTDLLAVWGLLRLALSVLRALRFGSGTVRFDGFPLLLGDELHFEIRIPCDLRLIEELTITLRAVEERFETRGHGRQRSTQLVCYETWSATLRPPEPAALASMEGICSVSFQPPADASPTQLSVRPATFWELLVEARRPGLDASSTWVVPVYSRPKTADCPAPPAQELRAPVA